MVVPLPVLDQSGAVVHTMHGATFTSYVRPELGSTELCAWRLELPVGSTGVAHTVSREEILLVLAGTLRTHLDGQTADAAAGEVVRVPAGSTFAADNAGSEPVSAWVTTSVGLEAVLADGTRISPPWTR